MSYLQKNYNVSLHELPSENKVFIIIIIYCIMCLEQTES